MTDGTNMDREEKMYKQVVVSDPVDDRMDNYNNYFFKDKGGEEHKLGSKRKNQDELVGIVQSNPSKAVTLRYDEYQGKAYIVDVALVEGQLEVKPEKLTEQQSAGKPKSVDDSIRDNMEWKSQQIEKSMEWKDKQINEKFWWGQLGGRIGDGSLDKDFPKMSAKIKGHYYKQMEAVTGVSFKE